MQRVSIKLLTWLEWITFRHKTRQRNAKVGVFTDRRSYVGLLFNFWGGVIQ